MVKLLAYATLAIAALSPAVVAAPVAEPDPTNSNSLSNLLTGLAASLGNTNNPFTLPCTKATQRVRRDFDNMQPFERKMYTDAVKCLMSKPSKLDPKVYPAAVNRYMDYAVVHVNRTRQVHLSGFFLTWHRHFLWLYEQDLMQQCGYIGAFPYWNWPATADNLKGSPIFDGSAYSMSGDGLFNDTGPIPLSPTLVIPHGSGGGCVTSGPFANMTTPMKVIPVQNLVFGLPLPADAFAYNPSCLTRDLNSYVAQKWTNSTALSATLAATDPATFDSLLNGVVGGNNLGLHSGAHFVVGSPGSSIYVSVMDPIWWPLHTMLDNVYTSWQLRHPSLANVTFGTETAVNNPPSPNVTLSTPLPDWGYFGKGSNYKVGDLISTTAGPYCYRYDVAL